MKEFAFRLKRGSDLKLSIQEYLNRESIDTAVVLCCVGCLKSLNIRLAGAISTMKRDALYEIVSLTGTYSNRNIHMHIAVSDSDGRVIGGHLLEGCTVDTTAELIFGVLDEYESERVFDDTTGYDEIVFRRVG